MGGSQSLHKLVQQDCGRETLKAACVKTPNVNIRQQIDESDWGQFSLQENTKWTPCQLAAWLGKVDAVEILISHGADVNLVDGLGRTSLHLAALKGHVPTTHALLLAGAQIDALDRMKMTPLHVATEMGWGKIVIILCRFHADVNLQDRIGRTPLHLASIEGKNTIAETLLEYGAFTLVKNTEGHTPLQEANAAQQERMFEILINAGNNAPGRCKLNEAIYAYPSSSESVSTPMEIQDNESAIRATMRHLPHGQREAEFAQAYLSDLKRYEHRGSDQDSSRSLASSVAACSLYGSARVGPNEDEVISSWAGYHAGMQQSSGFHPLGLERSLIELMAAQEPKPPERDVPFEAV